MERCLIERDIVLIPIPFTDLSSQRRRPVIIVSNDEYNRKTDDIVVVAMTSNLKPTDYGFVITSNDLEIGSLRHPSRVRVDKIYTVFQSITVRTFGRVNEMTFDRVCGLLRELTAKNS